MLSSEFCETFKNIFSYRTPPVAVSVDCTNHFVPFNIYASHQPATQYVLYQNLFLGRGKGLGRAATGGVLLKKLLEILQIS